MKTGLDALITVEIDYGRAKLKNWKRRPRYRRKLSERAKLENGSRRP
jgi:hypothetical protein